jgi:2-polyprenyl-3-methyl-5-hydroxy-6-metoxy-1,4-benzoquinol methylase
VSSLAKRLAAPLRAYFNPRFDAIVERLDALSSRLDRLEDVTGGSGAALQVSVQSAIDVGENNRRYGPSPFASFTSQAVDASHFLDASFREWFALVSDGGMEYHRKPWEYAFILERARQGSVLAPGKRALGFGVGQEPIPAVLARHGVEVLATDQPAERADHWKSSGEHADDVRALSRPSVVDDATLTRQVRFAPVDMNEVPADLGTFDFVWSSCAIEHLGSPAAGLEFVLSTAQLLRPGGVAVHTTELELTPKDTTADYGHCAVYRREDLEQLAEELRRLGFEIDLNLYVSMATPRDRYVALVPYPPTDPAHLKLQIFDSVSTSYGLALKRR